MPITNINVQRFSLISRRSFDSVLASLDAAIGHTDLALFPQRIAAAKTFAEYEEFIRSVTGSSGLMELARFDLGEILRKESGQGRPRLVRLVAGNPLIMKLMVAHVPDAGSYAPVTILVDERADGVHLSYDRMASLLASYGNATALKVAQGLDAKVEALLTSAAG